MLTFTARQFEGKVPEPGALTEADKALLEMGRAAFERVGGLIELARFKEALREVMALAGEANRYLDDTAPWKSVKTDRERAATSVYVILSVINQLKVLSAPFLPFSAQQLHELLGFEGDVSKLAWEPQALTAGQGLAPNPAPLFDKLDEDNVAVENEILGRPWEDPEGPPSEDKVQPRVVIFEGEVRTREELGEDFG
jgi:methionyl-tRNA synthetase